MCYLRKFVFTTRYLNKIKFTHHNSVFLLLWFSELWVINYKLPFIFLFHGGEIKLNCENKLWIMRLKVTINFYFFILWYKWVHIVTCFFFVIMWYLIAISEWKLFLHWSLLLCRMFFIFLATVNKKDKWQLFKGVYNKTII